MINNILRAVGKAYKVFAASYTHGKNTDEMFKIFENSLKSSLGEYTMVYDYIWGKDTAGVDGVTKNYIPKVGDTLIMDVSVSVGNTYCDVCRTFFVGEPTEEQTEAYYTVLKSLRAGSSALKAGVKASDVYIAANSVYAAVGKELIHHAGHRVGNKPVMEPDFVKDEESLIEEGLIYTVETGLYNGFGIRLENDFLVKKDGALDLFEEILPLDDIKEYILK